MPLKDAEKGLVGLYLLERVDAAEGSLAHVENLAGGRGDLRLLGKVKRGGLDRVVALEGNLAAETVAGFLVFELVEDQPTLTFLAGTSGTADTVNVLLDGAGETHLDDVGDIGEVHTTSGDIRGEKDRGVGSAEVLCGLGAGALSKLGVDFKDAGAATEGVFAATERIGVVLCFGCLELVEGRSSEANFSGAAEVDNRLEGTDVRGIVVVLLDLTGAKLSEGREVVLEALGGNKHLRHASVGRLLVVVDALDELETRLEGTANDGDDLLGNGGGEHESLAVFLLGCGKKAHDLLDLGPETLVEQTVGLIEDKCAEIGSLDLGVRVGENVL